MTANFSATSGRGATFISARLTRAAARVLNFAYLAASLAASLSATASRKTGRSSRPASG